MENDFLTEETNQIEQNYVDAENIQNDDAYSESGFKKYVNKYKNSPLFWPVIIVLLILLVGVIIFSLVVNSTGKLKAAKLTAPSIIYLGENETISAESIGNGNLKRTSFHYDISNSSIVELTSKAGRTGKKTTNELIPISTGKFLLYVDAELEDNKIERIEKEILICKTFSKEALQKEKITLAKGKSYTLHLDLGTKECYENISYEIEDEDVATVNENGKITSVSSGETNLIISNGKKEIKVLIKVIDSKNEVKVTGLKVDKKSISIEIRSTAKVNATVLPTNATNKSLKWESSNNAVATVSNKGVIKGIGKGNAKITVTTLDGEYKEEIIVTVTKTDKTNSQSTNKNVKVTSLKFTKKETALVVGGTERLQIIINPSNATNKKVKWTTSNSKVVTVDQTGKIEGKKVGTAIITATSGGKIAEIKVTVSKKEVAVNSVSVSPTSKTITAGESFKISATISPSNATNQTITWESNNNSVAVVDKNGNVTAKLAGQAIITARTNNGKTASANITVKAAPVKDTTSPKITYTIKSSKGSLWAESGDKITIEMTPSEELSNIPAVEIIEKTNKPITVTYKNGKYVAEYTVTESTPVGPLKMRIWSYNDKAGNAGADIVYTTPIEIKKKQQTTQTTTPTANTYTITYSANGGTGSMTSQTPAVGETPVIQDNKFTKSGYTFIGWTSYDNNEKKYIACSESKICDYKKSDYGWKKSNEVETYGIYKSGATFGAGGKIKKGNQVTMYAQWGKISATVKHPSTSKATITVNMNLPQKTQWTIYTSTDNKNFSKTSVANVYIQDTKTLSKSFDISRKATNQTIYIKACLDQSTSICVKLNNSITVKGTNFIIKFNPADGKGTMANQSIKYGISTALSANKFTREGYKFLGWVGKRTIDGKEKRLGCKTGNTCSNSQNQWLELKDITSYYIYKDKASVSQTAPAGETAEMVALWGKLTKAEKTNCSNNSCDISWRIDSSSRVSWDLYYNNTKSSSSKNIMGSKSGTMTNFTKGTSAKTITVKACLTSNSSICTNAINVSIPGTSTAGNNSTSQETTGMSICCLKLTNGKYVWDKISNYGIYDYSKVCVRTNGTTSALGGVYITTKSACEALNK